ncbi:MAG: hypothetical protein U5N27_19930 [Rhizobium sp.]|nr:hypothetical protein [Rhizobium sp.]
MEVYDGGLRLTGVRGVTLWIDVGTNDKRFDDVSGDPARATADRIKAAVAKGWDAIRAAHIADYKRLYDRFSIEFGPGRTELPTDKRIAATDKGFRSCFGGTLCPVRALSDDQFVAARYPACQPAGHLER